MRRLLAPSDFNPTTERRIFRIAMSDYGAAILLPGLLPVLRAEAPHVDLVVSQASREVMVSQIIDGEIDLALGVFPKLGENLRSSLLFEESFACLADRKTIGNEQGMDLQTYLLRPHVLVSLRVESGNEIDAALAETGSTRRVCLVLPHWSVAPDLVRGTDLVLTVARRILPQDAEKHGLGIFEPPFAIPRFSFRQIWHQRREGDPAHGWLRDRIARSLCPVG
jgi:DNA-binding transcriptional LysR family regulator